MSPVVTLDRVTLSYGHRPLLDEVDFAVQPKERIALVGRNGAGKSTLMQVVAGAIEVEGGVVRRGSGVRVAMLEQEVPADEERTVFEVVASALEAVGELVSAYHGAARAVANDHSDEALARLAELQQALEANDGWLLEQRVEQTISRLGLDPERRLAELSGGARRRVLLGRALVTAPDLLLLDEPTNHLDLETITWLEQFLLDFDGALLFITHDRAFLRRLATRIVELDRGQLTSWPGDYDRYLEKREEQLSAETRQAAEFDKKLAQEERWIRQGIKARRTRNEGRVRALQAMREERRQRRERQGSAGFKVESGERSGKRVVEVEHLRVDRGSGPLVRDLTLTIQRGDRVGILGPNGAGKTSLIQTLLGQRPPDGGKLRLGTNLQVAYFDQQRETIDPEKSVIDNLELGTEQVQVGGRSRHVISYLQDFLFSPEQARGPAGTLSGGERNRLLLARLFTRPANLLVMDEPTNDLDVETLELLEEVLGEFEGTLLLVSHDREFLDNVVTSTLVFEGNGEVREYVGGYQDWLRQRPAPPAAGSSAPAKARAPSPGPQATSPTEPRSRKLSYKAQRELEALPAAIEALEQRQADLHAQLADPVFYRDAGDAVARVNSELAALEAELAVTYARWEALESGEA